MGNLAGWIAPIATGIAAAMTAANLGSRITGWGFVVFTIGSVGWSIVGLASNQNNLIATNVFLTLVNIVGIWRWLGRQARYDKEAKAAVDASEHGRTPILLTANSLVGMSVAAETGEEIGSIVETMIECETGRVNYIVVRNGGIGGVGERLTAIEWPDFRFNKDRATLLVDQKTFGALPEWRPEEVRQQE